MMFSLLTVPLIAATGAAIDNAQLVAAFRLIAQDIATLRIAE